MFEKLPPGLTHVFAHTKLHQDDVEYVIVSFSPDQVVDALLHFSRLSLPFSGAVVDKDEVTLLLPWDYWFQVREKAGSYDEARHYRLITFDIPLDLGLIGFFATVSGLLAEAGVSIFAMSAYTRDHILVQEVDLQRALEILRAFFKDCRSRLDDSTGD